MASPSSFRNLPPDVAAAVALLIDAEKRASKTSFRCRKCGHVETLRVQDAEAKLLGAIRREYFPKPPGGVPRVPEAGPE